MPTATIDGLLVNYLVQGMLNAELWDALPPHQNGAHVLGRIRAFNGTVEHPTRNRLIAGAA